MSALFVLLLLIAVPLWVVLVAASSSLHSSDPAGNALGQAFTALYAIVLWIVLSVLMLIAGFWGSIPLLWSVAAWIFVPLSGVAVQVALQIMSRDRQVKWLVVLPACIPVILIAYSCWGFFPTFQAAIDPHSAGWVVWGLTAILIPLPWTQRAFEHQKRRLVTPKSPAELAADEVRQNEQYQRQRRDTFAGLTVDSSFSDWWSFIDDEEYSARALDGARAAKSRQKEVESRLGSGSRRLFIAVPSLDLSCTPELNLAIKAFLADQVANLRPYNPDRPMETSVVTEWFDPYLPVIRWLIDQKGHCEKELAAIEQAVKKYPDSPARQKFLAELAAILQSS